MNTFVSVLTTVQPPTESVKRLCASVKKAGGQLIVVGDKKGPVCYPMDNTAFFNLESQLSDPFELSKALPNNHYARKNVGYLHAILRQARCIYETDDDNSPGSSWLPRCEYVDNASVVAPSSYRWVNVYRYFTDHLIWPRGFPLDEIPSIPDEPQSPPKGVRSPVQQGLVDKGPDVDAIWRLIYRREMSFQTQRTVYLAPGNWCPFNTQNTWWWPVAFPLLYVPSFCSFRMCDIWKSFVAQRCLWALDLGVLFYGPDAVQERNEHSLMKDFRDEIPGYLENKRIVQILGELKLNPSPECVGANLFACYESLVAAALFPKDELALLQIWLSDLKTLL